MEYILDANNILGYMGRDRSSEHIQYFLNAISNMSRNHTFTVIFDGSQPPQFIYPHAHNINVVWQDRSRDIDADDTIQRYATKHGSRSQTIVVTADKMLHARVIDFVSRVMHPKDFILLLEPTFKQEYVPSTKDDEYVGVDEEGITEELRGIWGK